MPAHSPKLLVQPRGRAGTTEPFWIAVWSLTSGWWFGFVMHFELSVPWSEILSCPVCVSRCCFCSCVVKMQGECAVCLQNGAELALASAGLAKKSLRKKREM